MSHQGALTPSRAPQLGMVAHVQLVQAAADASFREAEARADEGHSDGLTRQ